jgi:hypothetical protein
MAFGEREFSDNRNETRAGTLTWPRPHDSMVFPQQGAE